MSGSAISKRRFSSLVIAGIVVPFVLAIWADSNFVDSNAYKKVKPGMTPAEVLQLLGEPSRRMGDPSTRDTASWVWSRWPPGKIMVVEFSHGRTAGAFNE